MNVLHYVGGAIKPSSHMHYIIHKFHEDGSSSLDSIPITSITVLDPASGQP